MKKILALSAILALFTGCTELNLPKPQMSQSAKTSDSNSEYLDCDKLYPEENDDKDKNNYLNRFECGVKNQDIKIRERREYEIRTFGN